MEHPSYWLANTRRLNRRRLLGSAVLAAGAAALAACGRSNQKAASGGPSAAPGGATASSEQPRRGGRFVYVFGAKPGGNNPYSDSPQAELCAGGHVYDRPFTVNFQKPYTLQACESIEQPDPLTVTMKLKPGMKYQDLPPVNGRAVVADDIVQDQLYVKALPNAESKSFQVDSMQSVEAPDDRTVVYKLKAPNAYLFSGNQLGQVNNAQIVPKELLDKLDTATPVGSGPYMQMSDTVPQLDYHYKRFDGFREASKGIPYVDEHEVKFLSDGSAIESAFRASQIDWWNNAPLSIAKRLQSDLGNKIVAVQYPSLNMQTFNTNPVRAPWNDPRVREAVYRILDRKQVLDLVESGDGVLPNGVLSASLTDYALTPEETAKYWKHDPQAGKQLLQAAGFDFNKDYEFILLDTGPTISQRGQVVQQQFSAVGVKSHLVSLQFPEWSVRLQKTANFDLNLNGNPGFDTPQQPLRYHRTDTTFVVQFAGIKDPKIDAMIDKSEQTLDPAALKKQVHDIQIALLDEYTNLIQLFSLNQHDLHWGYLRNMETSPLFFLVSAYQLPLWIAPH